MRSLTGPSAVILAARESSPSPSLSAFFLYPFDFPTAWIPSFFRLTKKPACDEETAGYVALLKDIEAVSSKCWPRLKTVNRASLLPEGAATTGNDDSENSSENAPVQISSSSSDSKDSVGEMADYRASHQARLKSRASTADKGKTLASARVPTPSLATLCPPAPLVIGASPTASITASPGHPPHRQIAGSKRPSKLNPVSAFKKIKLGLEATSNNGMAHAELRNKLKLLVAGSESLKSVKASHANELNEVGLKVTKLEVAMEEERKMPSV
nr:hypothetical protein Iba_chr12aCG12570 [Ipomoea batatas]